MSRLPGIAIFQTDSATSVLGTCSSDRMAYLPYGFRHSRGAPGSLGFNGELQEIGVASYALGHGYRLFNTVLMRFHSPDGWSPFGSGGVNSFGYCVGDPINRADASGRSSVFHRYASALFGDKKIFNVTRHANQFLTSEDKNGLRLTLSAHGGVVGGQSILGSTGLHMDAKFTHRYLLDNGVDFNKYTSFRVLSCRSADGSPSFIQEFSNLVGKPVKGYKGSVFTALNLGKVEGVYESQHRSSNLLFKTHKGHGVSKLLHHYRPVIVRPQW